MPSEKVELLTDAILERVLRDWEDPDSGFLMATSERGIRCRTLAATVRALREFSALQDKLLVCYRVGRTPTGKTLDRMHELRELLKGGPDAE